MAKEKLIAADRVLSPTALAILLTCLGFATFTFTDAIAKLASAGFPPMVIIFLQSLLGCLCVGSYGLLRHGRTAFKTTHPYLHAFRAGLGGCSSLLNVNALKTLQMDEFYAVIFIAPLVVMLLVAAVLKETLGLQRIIAVIIGFLCVLYMIQPGQSLFQIGALFAFISTLCYAVSCVVVRKIGQKDSALLFTFYTFCGGLAVSGTVLLINGVEVAPYLHHRDIWLIGVNGVLVIFGAFFVTKGLQIAPMAASVTSFHYTQMVWGVFLGYLIFGELPTTTVMIGATGLIATGLYLLVHEKQAIPKPVAVVILPD
ncbi:MAG: DMT family transporter [Pseudomonadota bacterium]|nr:DMT family transporter [Pseudomonadota bacterium]QKK04691.1 MAG: DMT family transporter [Pseudomonadota bacterium]